MKIIRCILSALFAWPFFVAVSCTDDDFTISENDRLSFSVDTLSFGTVITEQITSTCSFTVYNPNSKGLRIRSVRLASGGASPFKVNVDGVYVNEGYEGNIEIRRKDSIAVFVSLKAPAVGSDSLAVVHDRLCFQLESGLVQEIRLEAKRQDVNVVRGWIIEADTILSDTKPYQVFDSLYVAEGATLTVAPGVTFYFHTGSGMRIAGRIVAKGSMEQPVVFRGDRLDDIFVNQPYDRISGQWKGISIDSRSYDNVFEFCDIHSAYYGIRCDSADITPLKLRIENSVIHNMKGTALELRSCRAEIGNTQISNALDYCVMLYGGDSRFTHCTIANFYPFDFIRGGALCFTNAYGSTPYPLHAATFANSIITGLSSDEVTGILGNDKEVPFNYSFTNCLVAMEGGEEDANFTNVVWENKDNKVVGSGNFIRFDLDAIRYDFRLDSLSAAIGKADYDVTLNTYPFDRNGVSRIIDGVSDMGCYEFVPAQTP